MTSQFTALAGPPPLFEIAGLKKRYGATQALDGLDLSVRSSEVHALIGENGAGKSTLLSILAASARPDAGSIRFRGTPYEPADPLAARRLGVAHIHQELSLCPHLSVAENIFLGAEPQTAGWLNPGRLNQRAAEILASFPHPALAPRRKLGDLSIAARQIVEICRSLVQRSCLLLMDEPTSSLQRNDVDRLFTFIRGLRDSGVSIIYVSHFLEEVRAVSDSFTVLRDGRNVLSGRLGEVSDSQLVAAMAGRATFDFSLARHARRLPPGRSEDGNDMPRGQSPSEIVLRVENLSAPPAVAHASFHLLRGEVFGIAGLVGAGRTELLRTIFGLYPARAGMIQARLGGRDLSLPLHAGPETRMAAGIGYLSEDRKGEGLAGPLSVADNITLTKLAACARRGWINLARQRRRAEDHARATNVKAGSVDLPVRRLSGGNQQKVVLARLLHQGCEIFLLDEPTRGVDLVSKGQIYELIESLARSGKTILMVSSYLPELFATCDRLAVMCRGRLSAARSTREWTPETVLEAAVGG